jgi:hypothetical protein
VLGFFSSSSEEKEDENDGDDDDYENFTLAEQYSEHFDFVSGFTQPYVQNEITGVRVAVKRGFVKKRFLQFTIDYLLLSIDD